MSLNRVAAAAPVLARSANEAEQLLEGVQSLVNVGLPVVLVDGGSPPEFVQRLSAIPGVLVESRTGDGPRLQGQVLQALRRAAAEFRPDAILYTEPDKQWFFERRMPEMLAYAGTLPEPAGVVYSARDEASFATFPAVQRTPERRTNQVITETAGLPPGDLLYGPLLVAADLLPMLDRISDDLGWGWRIYLAVAAHRTGRPLHHWTAELPCPIDQRGEDDEHARLHRLRQMEQNIRGLIAGLSLEL